MSELERFAAALLAAWRASGGAGGGPIGVGALLDEVLPYRAARRVLGIDVSEDYEATVLRLIAEEDDLARTEPVDAADMARTTMASKLPDLDVLQLLRSATITIPDRVVARLPDVEVARGKAKSKWSRSAEAVVTEPQPEPEPAPAPSPEAPAASAAHHAAEESVAAADAVAAVAPSPPDAAVPQAPAVAASMPPGDDVPMTIEHCWSCGEELPAGRQIRFCPFCGADQRAPACAACGAAVERRWKYCPDCGQTLWSRDDG